MEKFFKKDIKHIKSRKKVSKEELKNCILIALEHNSDATDYIQNLFQKAEDNLKYNPDDEIFKDNYITLKYIRFVLDYVSDMYLNELESLGGSNGSCK